MGIAIMNLVNICQIRHEVWSREAGRLNPKAKSILNKCVMVQEATEALEDTFARLSAYQEFKKAEELQFEVSKEIKECDEIWLGELEVESIEDDQVGVSDEMDEINLAEGSHPENILISRALKDEEREQLITFLWEFKDCFALDYTEMPDIILVEYRLPSNEGFKPYMQPKIRMLAEVVLKVKEEVQRLFKARFIRIARYVEWLSNVVLAIKNGKLRICIGFRDSN